MAVTKTPEWVEPAFEIIPDYQKALDISLESTAKKVDAEYNGVLGTLPEWVPEQWQMDFEWARNSLALMHIHIKQR